jgi:hypothetical protein
MNLQENIHRIHQMMGVISESERGIENMINNLGVADTIKYMGGYNDSMKKYITNENKIDFIKDMVQHLSKPYNTIGISIYELGLNPVPYSISGDEVQQIEYFGPESAVIDVYYEGYHKSDFEEKYKNFDNHTLNDVFLFMLDTLNYYK